MDEYNVDHDNKYIFLYFVLMNPKNILNVSILKSQVWELNVNNEINLVLIYMIKIWYIEGNVIVNQRKWSKFSYKRAFVSMMRDVRLSSCSSLRHVNLFKSNKKKISDCLSIIITSSDILMSTADRIGTRLTGLLAINFLVLSRRSVSQISPWSSLNIRLHKWVV